jgi:diguanylate cyclase (GGDEF)-like protein/PAS domain S-box-containing protein
MSLRDWRPVLDGMLDAVWAVDPASLTIVEVNAQAAALMGLPREACLGRAVVDFTGTPEDVFFWEDVAAGLAFDIHSNTLLRNAGGVSFAVERKVSRIQTSAGEPLFLVGLRDLRPEQQMASQLEARIAELRATLESTGDGILVTDLSGRVSNYNQHFVDLWRMPSGLLEAHSDTEMFEYMASSSKNSPAYRVRMAQIMQDPLLDCRDVLELNSGRLVERTTRPQISRGRATGRVFAFRDLTDQMESQRYIENMAYTDGLTSLPNRILLNQRAEYALNFARRHGDTAAVLAINLDRFKNINDSLGHRNGDRVLIEVARRIRAELKSSEMLSRMSGDEFVVLLEGRDAVSAQAVARKIIRAVAAPFETANVSFSLSCSVGIAMFPDDAGDIDALVKCADAALCRAKEDGRGNFRFYQSGMNRYSLVRMKMDHAMRQGMEQGQFRLVYQPQVSLLDGRLLGAEALARWHDKDLGEVSPSVFINLAEESGFIISVGNWVLYEAVRQAAAWRLAGHPVPISVNVSPLQFQQVDFVERVERTLREANLPAALLELELTESILVRDANEALVRLHALADLGVSLAIDDFGTGYSSLAYLKKFPISKLKMDRTFVMGLPADEGDRAIVSATIGMANGLNLSVVAEGVETQAQRNYLEDLQCNALQGFLCSPGLAPNAFEKFISTLPQGLNRKQA